MVELDRRRRRRWRPRVLRSLGALLAVVSVVGVVPAAAQAGDLPTVAAHVTEARATEGESSDPGVVEITRTGDLGDALDVNYTTLYSTAARGQDYRHPAEGTPNGWRAITATAKIPAGERSVVLRADGASFDLGYTEDVLRPDGKIVTTYYFTSDPLAERTIEATIWDPVAAFGQARRG